MSGLETAIRNALDRADRTNAEIRARIYQSARNALEVGLLKQNVEDSEVMTVQRHRLETTIHQIEAEEQQRLTPTPVVPVVEPIAASAEPPPVIAVEPERRSAATPPQNAPVISVGENRAPTHRAPPVAMRAVDHPSFDEPPMRAEPSIRTAEASPIAAEKRAVPRRSRGTAFVRLFVFALIFAFIGIGVWWVQSTGLLQTAQERDGRLPNPDVPIKEDDFTTDGEPKPVGIQSGFTDNWTEVFSAATSSLPAAGSKAETSLVQDSNGNAVEVKSLSTDSNGDVSIPVPAAILQQMAGKTSTIAVTLAAGDQPSQVFLQCDFSTLGDCGRHRFGVLAEKSDFLFQVKFEGKLGPSEDGMLKLNSDISGKGQPVHLYAVRILPGE